MRRRLRSDQSGVSEVLGTILVLLITVILFSAIILWVSSLPAPSAGASVTFDGALAGHYVGGMWNGANMNLTHLGGEDLQNESTRVYLTINNNTEVFRTRGTFFDGVSVKAYGVRGPDAVWNIGETWYMLNETIPQGAQVSVMVVDLVQGIVLWQEDISGIDGEDAPVFLDKWFDSDTSTGTRDPVTPGDTFAIYARVIDPDGDLNTASVWAYLTFGSGGVPFGYVQMMDDGTAGDKVASDGEYSRSLGYSAQIGWDSGIIILNATDDGGRETQTRLILRVLNFGGTQIVTVGPQNLTFGSDVQRYDIFEESDWDTNSWLANSTRTYEKGETVVVVVASQYLPNVEISNEFMLYEPSVLPADPLVYGGAPVGPTTNPSDTQAFTFFGYASGFYIYEYRFNTDSRAYGFPGVQLVYGQYTLSFDLHASNVPPLLGRFATVDTITVTDMVGGAPDYPRVQFFKDGAHTQESNTFNFTEIVFVKITVRETDATVTSGDVSISDFIGGVQIWSTPGNYPPFGNLTVNDTRSYQFPVDLSVPNFDQWNFGTNSYGFRIKELNDSNEQYSLTGQVIINGPRWKLDVIAGFNDFIARPCEMWYATFYDNNGFWPRTVVQNFVAATNNEGACDLRDTSLPPWSGDFLDVAFGDIDEDGDLDAIYGLQDGYVFWFRNLDGNGKFWSRYEFDAVPSGQVLTVDVGRADRDADNDVVAGTSGNQVLYYSNDGVWTRTVVDTITCDITSIKFSDITADGFNDIVAGTGGLCNQVRVYENDGLGNFAFIGAFPVGSAVTELVVADMDLDGILDVVVARGSEVRVVYGPGFTVFDALAGGSNVLTVDVGYIDGDATLDVVIGTTANNLYWFANDGTWLRTLLLTAPHDIETLRVGDVDGDLWDDIVFGLDSALAASNNGEIWVVRHILGGTAWITENIEEWLGPLDDDDDFIPPVIRGLDIGDADRGVIIRHDQP